MPHRLHITLYADSPDITILAGDIKTLLQDFTRRLPDALLQAAEANDDQLPTHFELQVQGEIGNHLHALLLAISGRIDTPESLPPDERDWEGLFRRLEARLNKLTDEYVNINSPLDKMLLAILDDREPEWPAKDDAARRRLNSSL